MSAKINLKITGVRGGSPSYHENKGRVTTFIDNGDDFIAVDAFDGFDKTYKRREKSEIQVTIGKTTWKGTKQELLKLISPSTKEEKISEELGRFVANEIEDYPAIIKALRKALKKNSDGLIDNIQFGKGENDTISPIQRLEFTYTVKDFCDLIGIEG